MQKKRDVGIGTDEMIKIQMEITLGVKKEDSEVDMTDDYKSKMWDKIEAGIKRMPEGMILDIRPEIPSA